MIKNYTYWETITPDFNRFLQHEEEMEIYFRLIWTTIKFTSLVILSRPELF